MVSPTERLDALEAAARDDDLTPLAWWIGLAHHDDVLQALQREADREFSMEGKHLATIDGLDVKVLTESPQRLALWCEEGALDL